MSRDVFVPLAMDHSSVLKPRSDSRGIAPQSDSMWAYNIGDEAASGGMYSSSKDLAKLARAILGSAQLPPSATRQWLKAVANTSTLTLSVGALWEIWRTKSNITNGRTIDLYTKSGSIGFSVAINAIAEMAVQSFLPILEQASQQEAAQQLAGHYAATTSFNSSLWLTVYHGPGLKIEKWTSNDSDIMMTAQTYSDATNGGQIRSVRLYPTDLMKETCFGSRVAYRAIFDVVADATQIERVFDQDSNTWATTDQVMYENVAVGNFVFDLDMNGASLSVEPRVLNITFQKVSSI
ncbi:hypothetical protein LTR66_010736 [Elasticomyces elasticus]|nr:hypothetical protein LTR28_006748 [Elasticomyces elasticus]KAK4977391.1 hypothetical protein LTR66_010736 [Elasticomyces elasticus]